jgi:hypothetical protein
LTSAKLTVVINQVGHALVASSSEDLAKLPAQQSPTP